MGKLIKTGSIYQLTDIKKHTANVFSKHGRFIVKILEIRLTGISDDSYLVVSINGFSSSYMLSDIASAFQTKIPYVPFIMHYYLSPSNPDGNDFIIGFYTDDVIESLSIDVKIAKSSNPKYSVESVLYYKTEPHSNALYTGIVKVV